MASYKVDISQSTEQDVRDLIRYISLNLSAPQTAKEMLETIEKALEGLTTMPEIHPHVQDEALALAGFRKLIIKNYIAFFIVDNKTKTVDVVRVLYSKRNWQHIL